MGKPVRDWRLELRDGRRGGTGRPLTRGQLEARQLANHLERDHGNVVNFLSDISCLMRRHRGAHLPTRESGHTHERLNPGDDIRSVVI